MCWFSDGLWALTSLSMFLCVNLHLINEQRVPIWGLQNTSTALIRALRMLHTFASTNVERKAYFPFSGQNFPIVPWPKHQRRFCSGSSMLWDRRRNLCSANLHPKAEHFMSKWSHNRQWVDQSVLVSGPVTNSSFSFKCSLDNCGFVILWCRLWREGGSVWVQRDSTPYFILPNDETPPTWRARSQYLYPPGAGWPSCTPVPFPSPLKTRGASQCQRPSSRTHRQK
jgi:hypothetical protein